MKNLRTSVLCIYIILYSLCAATQNQQLRGAGPGGYRPKMFQSLPENISVSSDNLNVLLNKSVGNTVSFNLSDNSEFKFEGLVVSSSGKEGNIQTVVIRSTNYSGARLTLSKIRTANGTVLYSGRILSFQHGDMFELKSRDGHYVLIKRKFNDLVNE